MNRTLVAATLVAVGAWARAASADTTEIPRTTDPPTPVDCARPLDADAVLRCALAASPEVRAARAQLDAAAGRRATAAVLLPSNPTIAGTVSNRRRPPPEQASVLNWSVIVQQEIEIAGQRGARIDEA